MIFHNYIYGNDRGVLETPAVSIITIWGAPSETITYSGVASGTLTLNSSGNGTISLAPGAYSFVGSKSKNAKASVSATIVEDRTVCMWGDGAMAYWFGRVGTNYGFSNPNTLTKKNDNYSDAEITKYSDYMYLHTKARTYWYNGSAVSQEATAFCRFGNAVTIPAGSTIKAYYQYQGNNSTNKWGIGCSSSTSPGSLGSMSLSGTANNITAYTDYVKSKTITANTKQYFGAAVYSYSNNGTNPDTYMKLYALWYE